VIFGCKKQPHVKKIASDMLKLVNFKLIIQNYFRNFIPTLAFFQSKKLGGPMYLFLFLPFVFTLKNNFKYLGLYC
jgi:hypothetical protein